MSGEFLSQDEVDALLRGVSGEEESTQAGAPAAEDGTRPYNLATQERIVRGRMPALDVINDRFVRLLRVSLFNFLRRSPEVSLLPVKVQKYSEFIRNLVVPTNLNIMAMRPLRGNTLFVFEPSLVFTVIDSMFGGDGRFRTQIEGRDFSSTEQRIIQRMLSVITEEYQKSWKPVHSVQFDYVRSEMHTQFASIATPSEVVVVSSFKIELGDSGGALHICIPYSTLEPIRDVLYSTMQGDHFEPDRRWLRMLKQQVQLADVELVAKLANVRVTIQQLLNMKVGDVLSVDMPNRLEASVDGVPIFECEYGTSSGQYAVKVGRVLAVSQKDNQLGEFNG
jgi:flagellar motor switch protein FliM